MTQSLKIGVLLCSGVVQLLDLAAVDLLAMLSSNYLRLFGLPEDVVALGHEVKLHYIADAVKGEAPTESLTSADARVRITDTLDSVDALDILLIPGPAPSYVPSPQTIAFIQKQTASAKAVLIICSGILPTAFSGILANKRATAPLVLLPTLREKMPNVDWVAKRWTTDDDDKKKIWTSGGVTNGTDMVAAYLKENFDPQLVNLICALADVGDRGQEYPEWQLNLKLDLKLI
ncbi:hypothetical protein ACEPAG_8148 [Sanghuangporus baumii]